jgi:hypothetical protein
MCFTLGHSRTMSLGVGPPRSFHQAGCCSYEDERHDVASEPDETERQPPAGFLPNLPPTYYSHGTIAHGVDQDRSARTSAINILRRHACLSMSLDCWFCLEALPQALQLGTAGVNADQGAGSRPGNCPGPTLWVEHPGLCGRPRSSNGRSPADLAPNQTASVHQSLGYRTPAKVHRG